MQDVYSFMESYANSVRDCLVGERLFDVFKILLKRMVGLLEQLYTGSADAIRNVAGSSAAMDISDYARLFIRINSVT